MPADDPIRKLALAALDADAQARALLSPEGARARVSFSDLYRYANDPGFVLAPELGARLAVDDAAQADLAHLLANGAFAHIPRQAAAASGAVERRETEKAVLVLTPSRAGAGEVYLSIELRDASARPPSQLFARKTGEAWQRLALPVFSDAQTQVLLDADAALARALADPETEVYLR